MTADPDEVIVTLEPNERIIAHQAAGGGNWRWRRAAGQADAAGLG